MRLVKFTLTQEHGDPYPVFINPDHVERVRSALSNEKVGNRSQANTCVVISGKVIFLKEAIDEVVAALTSSTLAARLAAKI